MEVDIKRICFVCLGNIVRSPLAEGLFSQQAVLSGAMSNYEVDSAGTGDWHVGDPPDARMRRVAARHGLIYEHRARQFGRHDLDRFDLILAMDRENRDDLFRLAKTPAQQAKIHLLREYDPNGAPDASVPDPYYDGIDGFEEVYDIIKRSVIGLMAALENSTDNLRDSE
jgi:protein-tyrosine phosphatase